MSPVAVSAAISDLAGEVIVLAGVALGEDGVVVEDEVVVADEVQHDRRGGHREVAGRLGARAVEVLVAGVQGNGEQAAGLPLEAVLALAVVPDASCCRAR